MPSALTPFLRSDAQGAILAEVFLNPEREASISELARSVGAPSTTIHREASRLIEAGVVIDRTAGRNRFIRANTDHPLFAPMQEVVAATYGPVPVLRHLLAELPTIQEAYIYGSWAQRRSGRPGHFPRDVDVLVVGDIDRADTVEVGIDARAATGHEVNIHVVTPEAWAAPASTFLQNVREQPLVPLIERNSDGTRT